MLVKDNCLQKMAEVVLSLQNFPKKTLHCLYNLRSRGGSKISNMGSAKPKKGGGLGVTNLLFSQDFPKLHENEDHWTIILEGFAKKFEVKKREKT